MPEGDDDNDAGDQSSYFRWRADYCFFIVSIVMMIIHIDLEHRQILINHTRKGLKSVSPG